MSTFKVSIALLATLLTQPFAEAQFVVGPSVGPVFGPAPVQVDTSGLTLNKLKIDYKLISKDSDDADIQNKIYSLDMLDGKKSCSYDDKALKVLNVGTGVARLDLMQSTVAMLDKPEMAKPMLNPDQSESAKMTVASETLGASQLTANESDANKRTQIYLKACETLNAATADKNSKVVGTQNQLNYYSCTMYQIMSHLTGLYADSDTLYQKATELETIVNKAMEEQTTRNAGIQKQENKIKEVNKELTTALDKLKKAKADLKKATEALKKSQDALAAANKIECSKADDGTEDCSARDAAVASAAADVAKAQASVDKAKKDVEKASKELLELLKTKMNFETRAILGLLSGTIYGDANGEDVHFKVSGKEFTLADTDKILEGMFGLKDNALRNEPHWGRLKLENPNATEADYQEKIAQYNTDLYFGFASQHLAESKDADKKYYMMNIGEMDRDSARLMTSNQFLDEKATSSVLDKFYSMGNGVDNIETIASALADYQANDTSKQVANLEAMKTPDSRAKYNAMALDKTNELNRNIRAMILNNICYLDSMLVLFHKTYDQTKATQADFQKDAEPVIEYLYNFTTKRYKQKLEEGYTSKVKVEDILREFDVALAKQQAKDKNKSVEAPAKN